MKKAINPIKGMSKDEMFVYVYDKAKEYGDPHPEVVAAQFMLESGGGTSNIYQQTNNAFGLTALSTDSKSQLINGRRWKKFNSLDESIKYRVDNWSLGKTSSQAKKDAAKKYREAKDPLTAMAAIQPLYAPSEDNNAHYMKAIAGHLKAYEYYNGDTEIPNADVNPEYYEKSEMTENGDYRLKGKSNDDIIKDYENRKDQIQYDSSLPNRIKQVKMDNLNKEFFQKGYIKKDGNGIIQEHYKKANQNLEQEFNQKKEDLTELIDFLNQENLIGDSDVQRSIGRYTIDLEIKKPEDRAKFIKLIKKYPELNSRNYTNKQIYNNSNKTLHVNILFNGKNPLMKRINKDAKSLGIDLGIYNEKGFESDDLVVGKGEFGTNTRLNIPSVADANFNKLTDGVTTPVVNPNWTINPIEEEQSKQSEAEGKGEQPVAKAKDVGESATDKSQLVQDYEDYFSSSVVEPDTQGGYSTDDYKNNFPFADVIGGLAGGVTGIIQANKKTPRRDEKVSDAFMNYTAELKKLSEIGLRPEDEAHAKQMLSESYQGMLEQVHRASAGNRNIVLGNLGRIDSQNQKGMLALALADAEAKDINLAKYGEATKYINEFNARRDIANNERDYTEAMMSKEAGAQLAQASFSKMMNDIQYAKENGPGSANHMYKSYFFRKNYGVDPFLKDQDNPDKKYTKAWKEKQDAENLIKYELMKDNNEKFGKLNPTAKQTAAELFEQSNADSSIQNNVLSYMLENNVQSKRFNLNNYSEAIKENNYGMLFEDMAKVSVDPELAQEFKFPSPEAPTLTIETPEFLQNENKPLLEQVAENENYWANKY